YYAYGFPGRSPPPPPPPQHLVAPYFGQPHEIPMNGAPVGLDPAHAQPGGYNRDAYSSYGDFMSNSGAIRIHHPPQHQPQPQPPLPSSSMRSPVHQQHPHASAPESEIHAGAGLHTSSVGSAAPQPLHPPAQSYESASSYAAKMQSQSKAAEMHVPAIYARRDTDIAARFSDIPAGFARAMPQPPMSLTPATPAQPFAHSRDQPLSSPGHKVSERSFNDPPMTVPVSSAPVFKHVVQHESRLYAVRSPDQPWSPPSVSSKPLPFSNGASRPKLPPLSEIFGKDYQSVRSPGGLR
ncbi:hypothetical protein FB639_006238, partial [Coemansia asiatica]